MTNLEIILIILSVSLFCSLVFFFLIARYTLRRILTQKLILNNLVDKYKNDLHILTEQYRQLANINKALRDIQPIKNLKKK